jgi:hypothetical protein
MKLHPHAAARMRERGASEEEIAAALREGEQFSAKLGRTGFRRNFSFDGVRHGHRYYMKQVEVFAIWEDDDWLVITIVVKYF